MQYSTKYTECFYLLTPSLQYIELQINENYFTSKFQFIKQETFKKIELNFANLELLYFHESYAQSLEH